MDASPSAVRTAPAKINLYLNVLGQRDDGYHAIETVFLPLPSPADTIAVTHTPGRTLSLRCDVPELPAGDGNLCWQAATALAEELSVAPCWRIELEKRIPVAAGLGGGSSDAAATLLALSDLQEAPIADARVRAIAARLGADVPFFLRPSPALATGVGEMLRTVPLAATLHLLLLNPRFPVSAAWAYRNRTRVSLPEPPPLDALLQAMATGDVPRIAALSYNALEHAVRDKFPLVAMLCELMVEHGCLAAHVSGSGPTVYGLFAEPPQAAAEAARDAFGAAVWVHTTRVCAAVGAAGGHHPCS
jgi:4-diphosphocytidyl-2-C-methyl-D-erythritol kinase